MVDDDGGCVGLNKEEKPLTLVRDGRLRARGDEGLRRRATMTTKAGRIKKVGCLNIHCPNIAVQVRGLIRLNPLI